MNKNKNLAISAISAIGLFIGTFILMKLKVREVSNIAAVGLFSTLVTTFLMDYVTTSDLNSQIENIAQKHGVKVNNNNNN